MNRVLDILITAETEIAHILADVERRTRRSIKAVNVLRYDRDGYNVELVVKSTSKQINGTSRLKAGSRSAPLLQAAQGGRKV